MPSDAFHAQVPATAPGEPARRTSGDDDPPLLVGPQWLEARVVAQVRLLKNNMIAFARIVCGLMGSDLEHYTRDFTSGLNAYLSVHGHDMSEFIERNSVPAPTATSNAQAGVATLVQGPVQPMSPLVGAAVPSAQSGAGPWASGAGPWASGAGSSNGRQDDDAETPLLAQGPAPSSSSRRSRPASSPSSSLLTTPTSTRQEASDAVLALALSTTASLHAGMLEYTGHAARALERREAATHARATIEWLQLPEHLGHIFFRDTLSSCLVTAYGDVTDTAQRADLTFGELTSPRLPYYRKFAELVACNMRIVNARTPRRYVTESAGAVSVQEHRALVRWFREHGAAHSSGEVYDVFAGPRTAPVAQGPVAQRVPILTALLGRDSYKHAFD